MTEQAQASETVIRRIQKLFNLAKGRTHSKADEECRVAGRLA